MYHFQAYREEAINQLKKDFRFASLTNIRRVFSNKNNHYTPTYFNLLANPMTNQRKTKRTPHEYSGTAKDLFLIQEVFVKFCLKLKLLFIVV